MPDLTPSPSDLIPLLPGAGGAVLLVLTSGFLIRRGARGWAALLAALAFVVALFVTWLSLHDELPLPPRTSSERGLWSVAALGAAGFLSERLRRHPPLVWLLHYAVTAGVLWWILASLLQRAPDSESHVSSLRLLALIGGVLALWAAAEALADRVAGFALPLAWALAFGAAGQLFFLYGSGGLAQLSGTSAIALGLLAVGSPLLPERKLPRAAAGTVAGITGVLCTDAYHYMSAPPPALSLVLLAGAPLLLVLSLIPGIAAMRPARRFAMQMSIVVVVVAAAFWVGYSHVPVDEYGGHGVGK